jgi:hypothetical protein
MRSTSNASLDEEHFNSAWAVISSAAETLYDDLDPVSDVSSVDFSAVFKSLYTLISSTSRRQDVTSLLSRLIAKSLNGVIQSGGATLRLYVDHLDLAMRDMSEILQEDSSLAEVS